MASLTPNYSLILPSVNDPTDQDLWGGMLNSNFSAIDTLFVESIKTVTNSVTMSGNITEAESNKIVLANATSGNITLLLLAAATAGNGFKVAIKKTDASANTVTLDPNGSETIDGEATYVLSRENESVFLVSDGANWKVISDYNKVVTFDDLDSQLQALNTDFSINRKAKTNTSNVSIPAYGSFTTVNDFSLVGETFKQGRIMIMLSMSNRKQWGSRNYRMLFNGNVIAERRYQYISSAFEIDMRFDIAIPVDIPSDGTYDIEVQAQGSDHVVDVGCGIYTLPI
jgi:hypothetical protein